MPFTWRHQQYRGCHQRERAINRDKDHPGAEPKDRTGGETIDQAAQRLIVTAALSDPIIPVRRLDVGPGVIPGAIAGIVSRIQSWT